MKIERASSTLNGEKLGDKLTLSRSLLTSVRYTRLTVMMLRLFQNNVAEGCY